MLRLLLCTLLLFSTWSVVATELERADSALMRGDYAAAVEILETLSAKGNGGAMTLLASLYHRGEGVPRDIDKAVELYLVAAELGQAEAQFNLGNMYLLGEGVPQDESWALSFYRLAAKQGHELATQNMRELYRASGGTEPAEPAMASQPPGITSDSPLPSGLADVAKSADEAVEPQSSTPLAAKAPAPVQPEMSRPAAEAPERVAQPDKVDPVPPDAPIVTLKPVEARVEAPAQALTSDQSAALRLAKAHGIAIDIETETDSADASKPAMAAAAVTPVAHPVTETTVSDSAVNAADLAAKFERAERMLALENNAAAIAQLTALAAAGHAGSAWRLAALHAHGQGVPKDDEKVLQWQERAAALGHVDAQFELGEKYSRGLGVAPDEAMAITYYRAAARGGHVQAREILRQIYDEAGLPMPELGRRRAPIAITATVTEEPVGRAGAAPAPVASLPAISRRDPIENTMAETVQMDPAAAAQAVTDDAGVTESTVAAAMPRREDENPVLSASTAGAETTAAVAAISSPRTVEPETARADIPQPRLAPDAIVIHPERIEVPANAVADLAPSPPANHEVVPGSVLATTNNATATVAPQPSTNVAAQAATGASSYSDADAASAEGTPVATTIVEGAANASDDLTSLPAVAEDQIAVVRPEFDPLETTQARSVADEAVGEFENAEKTIVAASTPDTPAAAIATGAVASTAATATESVGSGLFKRIAGLFGRESDSTEVDLSEQAAATPPQDVEAAAAEAGALNEKQISEPVAVSATEPASAWAGQAANASATSGTTSEPVVEAEASSGSPRTPEDANQDVAAGKRALAAGDLTGAVEIFSRLAEAGDAEAQAHIGYMYYIGEGVDVDLVRAVDWYRRAAVQGNRDAQYNLAVAYAFGEGVQQNDDEAAIWYRRAAEQGSAIAQYSLGMSYALGEGAPQDDVEAAKWYRAAADQGYAAAQYNLGYSYRTGHGVVADEAEAIRWFEAAAANGHAAAQYSLGYMYRSGRGVERDVEEAIKWYRLAAAQGHPDARADLASLNPDG